MTSTLPPLQVSGQCKLQRDVTALMDLNAPFVPPILIRNVVEHQPFRPCPPKCSTVESRPAIDYCVVHRERHGLHSLALDEETLGARYTMRLERGRPGA